MTKLNPIVYRKLVAQAEEAKEQGLTKLAENIMEAVGTEPAKEAEEYSYDQLQGDVKQQLWKAAAHVVRYYGLDSANAVKLDNNILILASEVMEEIEHTLGVGSMVKGPLEPKLPGENK